MKLQAGTFLRSTEALAEDFFSGALILLTEYNSRGATGFVVNRPFGRTLIELTEFRHAAPFPLYEGGPVDQEHLFVLHCRPDLVSGATPVGNGLYLGGNFSEAVAAINSGQLHENNIRIFVGYCGWDAGELEAEIAEGSWTLTTGEVFG